MGTTATYTAAEMSPLTDSMDIARRTALAGYTNPGVVAMVGDDDALSYTVTVEEDSVDPATLLSDIQSETPPTLTLDVSTLEVPADGTSTGVADITGPAGGVVKLSWREAIPVSASEVTLDGSGEGSVTFGPSSLVTGSPVKIVFTLQLAIPLATALDLSFTVPA